MSKTIKIAPKRYYVTRAYESPYPYSIEFRKGEQVNIKGEYTDDPDWKNWVWCKGAAGKEAWVPIQYLTIMEGKGIFKCSYNAMEISVKKSEKLTVYEEINGFGMAEKADGTRGWIPLRNLAVENGQ